MLQVSDVAHKPDFAWHAAGDGPGNEIEGHLGRTRRMNSSMTDIAGMTCPSSLSCRKAPNLGTTR